MKARILDALRDHGPLTYGDLAAALGLDRTGSIVEFDDALILFVSDGKVIRDEGERAGRPAVYRLATGATP